MNFTELTQRLNSLVVFRSINKNPKFLKFVKMLNEGSAAAYADFISALYEQTDDLSKFILELVLENDNVYVRTLGSNGKVSKKIERSALYELDTLTAAASLTSDQCKKNLDCGDYLPDWNNTELNIKEIYLEHLKEIGIKGYGIFYKYNSFILDKTELKPIRSTDSINFDDLAEYKMEREKVVDNTTALLNGLPALNVLLYGDAGTGKSATVKAVAKKFADRGLRLIEVKKQDLTYISDLLERLYNNPLKFIIFIDDLSFNSNDDNFAALKAVLEGSAAAIGGNTVIYATSNRRHLLKESFSDREGDDMHLSDTIEESISLSERFGLTVTFSRPDKEKYTAIVKALSRQYGITLTDDDIVKAEAFAMRHGGRSPRAAKQFIEILSSKK